MYQHKVLVVDDNAQNIQVLGSVLKEANYQIGFATNGKQALDILNQSNNYDLVLLDIDMPILDGYETCKIIRSTEKLKDIPVIFLTAFTEEENIVKGFDYGAQDYVFKPFNPRELLARVDTHIQLKNKTEQLKQMNQLLEKKVEERTAELKTALEKAEAMYRLKSNFLANMSHELRTPLIGILGFAEFLKQDLKEIELKEMAENIYLSGMRLSETLNLILDLSKIESEKHEFNFEKVDLIKETKEILNLFSKTAEKQGLYLKSSFSHPSIQINIDERAYRTILNNLINNALKFTVEGGINVDISLQETLVEIKVEDTGIGIPEEYHNIIFEEFRQVSEGLGRNFEGTGLGLSITKKLVEKFGGEISVESKLRKGSTFIVKLPITTDDKISKKKVAIQIDEKKLKFEDAKVKPLALIVDDDPLVYPVMKRYLEGYLKLESTTDGKFAINLCKKKKYDLIFMDINLKRGFDGKQLTRELRKLKEYENIPIIATTAYAMVGDREEFLAAGCSHYISKPFKKEDLLDLVVGILNKKT
ncbi:response regulator [Stygiobacter electus]|uniref:histidine kinase n=1 Tax=Stygiobacter electus TaxID=3032292 RepID=A0AAE3TC00_9BACT|nr:response regulator [Stygiobacter electus]MDF1611385.1 response regulator [Stygiobacter electus]